MRKLVLLISLCLASGTVLALPDYEPFSDSTGFGGTSYSTGAFLAGQTNAAGQPWWELGPNYGLGLTPQPTIAAGDLIVPGLYSAGGGHSAAFGGNGDSARLNLSVSAGGIQSGSVFFSFAMKLTDLSGLTTGGAYWAGFNNVQSINAGTATPGTIVSRVLTRSATGGYNIGLQEGASGSFNTAWDSRVFTTSDTIFLVGNYTFVGVAGTDDSSQLWINADSSSFGAGVAPTADLTSSGGTDIARVASFMLFDRSAAEPAGGLIDDLRFGVNWADVTPAVPEPSALGLGALGLAALCVGRRSRRQA